MARESAELVVMRRALGEKLATFRRAAKMTQAQLAAVAFCDRSRVAHLERGRGNVDHRFWLTADDALGAGGLLVEAEQKLRAALHADEDRRQAREQQSIEERIGRWREGQGSTRRGLTESVRSAAAWLDRHAGWASDESGRQVAALLDGGLGSLASKPAACGSVPRSAVARALTDYYGSDGQVLRARVGRAMVTTSVLSRPEWLHLAIELRQATDRLVLRVDDTRSISSVIPTDGAAQAAVRRLAEIEAGGVRVANVPIYRLTDVRTDGGMITGSVVVSSFIEYALTMDLLEGELRGSLAGGCSTAESLPLRDAYLPNVDSVLAMDERLCAGGALAFFAVARPREPGRDRPDYMLLVQRRSRTVLNAVGSLSVVPKGFHAPMVDYRADARIASTLMRELEEELFGRVDVDSTEGPQRAADPMHRSRMSEPLRWLTSEPGRLRVEATGFGLNLVSGNYEFASLIVVQDETFWTKFGGQIEANWEADGLMQYSSQDAELLSALVADESWSNEGLFAFVLGLRRLQVLDPDRVCPMDVEVSLP